MNLQLSKRVLSEIYTNDRFRTTRRLDYLLLLVCTYCDSIQSYLIQSYDTLRGNLSQKGLVRSFCCIEPCQPSLHLSSSPPLKKRETTTRKHRQRHPFRTAQESKPGIASQSVGIPLEPIPPGIPVCSKVILLPLLLLLSFNLHP